MAGLGDGSVSAKMFRMSGLFLAFVLARSELELDPLRRASLRIVFLPRALPPPLSARFFAPILHRFAPPMPLYIRQFWAGWVVVVVALLCVGTCRGLWIWPLVHNTTSRNG